MSPHAASALCRAPGTICSHLPRACVGECSFPDHIPLFGCELIYYKLGALCKRASLSLSSSLVGVSARVVRGE
jgi:hypothetical protein